MQGLQVVKTVDAAKGPIEMKIENNFFLFNKIEAAGDLDKSYLGEC